MPERQAAQKVSAAAAWQPSFAQEWCSHSAQPAPAATTATAAHGTRHCAASAGHPPDRNQASWETSRCVLLAPRASDRRGIPLSWSQPGAMVPNSEYFARLVQPSPTQQASFSLRQFNRLLSAFNAPTCTRVVCLNSCRLQPSPTMQPGCPPLQGGQHGQNLATSPLARCGQPGLTSRHGTSSTRTIADITCSRCVPKRGLSQLSVPESRVLQPEQHQHFQTHAKTAGIGQTYPESAHISRF